MNKINVRIDERLIHGQVATMWTNVLNVDRIIVVDNEVIKNDTEKEVLKMAKPGNVKLSILSIKGASERIKNGKYNDETVLILVKSPNILYEMTEFGVVFEDIIVGNMSKKLETREITKSVSISERDEKIFLKLRDRGIKIYSQMVPNDTNVDFVNLLNGGN